MPANLKLGFEAIERHLAIRKLDSVGQSYTSPQETFRIHALDAKGKSRGHLTLDFEYLPIIEIPREGDPLGLRPIVKRGDFAGSRIVARSVLSNRIQPETAAFLLKAVAPIMESLSAMHRCSISHVVRAFGPGHAEALVAASYFTDNNRIPWVLTRPGNPASRLFKKTVMWTDPNQPAFTRRFEHVRSAPIVSRSESYPFLSSISSALKKDPPN